MTTETVMKILAINPGSTSTKIAVFENEKEFFIYCLYGSIYADGD